MDNQWRKKFDDAQVPPPDGLWDKIASDLDSDKKGGFLFPPVLGWAATITVVLLSGILVYQNTTTIAPTSDPKELVRTEETTSGHADVAEQRASQSLSENDVTLRPSPTLQVKETDQPPLVTTVAQNADKRTLNSSKPTEVVKVGSTSDFSEMNATEVSSGLAVAEGTANSEDISETIEEADVVQTKVAKKPQEKYEYPSADDLMIERNQPVKSKKRAIWIGMAQGVGGYSTQFGTQNSGVGLSTSDPTFTLERAIASVQNEPQSINEQVTLNSALQLGLPLGENLSIITGFSYNRSNFTSEATAVDGQLLHFTAENIEVNTTSGFSDFQNVNLKGSYEMAVMPILADYRIVSGNLNWSIQAGPEIGFMLKQQIRNEDLGLSRSTGSGGLYEPLHLRVALGTTFTYGLNDHFLISFQPLIEQAVTSITSQEASFESKPLYYSALFGLRYSF
jgi:hypothetical protein